MDLLIFFALPLATILLSIVLDRIIRSPSFVAIFIFSIYLIGIFIAYALGNITNLGIALVALIIYTIIAFFSAYFFRLYKRANINNNQNEEENEEHICINNNANARVSIQGNIIPNQTNSGNTGVIRGCYRRY